MFPSDSRAYGLSAGNPSVSQPPSDDGCAEPLGGFLRFLLYGVIRNSDDEITCLVSPLLRHFELVSSRIKVSSSGDKGFMKTASEASCAAAKQLRVDGLHESRWELKIHHVSHDNLDAFSKRLSGYANHHYDVVEPSFEL